MEKPLYLQDSPSFVDLCTLHQHAMRYYRLWIYACNTVLALATLVFTVFAVSVLVDPRISLLSGVELYQPTFLYAYVALLLQCGVLQTIGCLGALRLNQKLLNTYWTLLLLLMIGDIIVGLIWAFRLDRIKTDLRPTLKNRLRLDYGNDPDFTQVWDWVQSQDMCCGVDGPFDDFSEPKLSNNGSITDSGVYNETTSAPPAIIKYIPSSCCTLFAHTNSSQMNLQARSKGSYSSQESKRLPPNNLQISKPTSAGGSTRMWRKNPGGKTRHFDKTDSGGGGDMYPRNIMSQQQQQSKQSQMSSPHATYQLLQYYQQTTESSSSTPGVQYVCETPSYLLATPATSNSNSNDNNNLKTNINSNSHLPVDANNNNNYNTNLKSSHNTKHSSDSNDVLKITAGAGGGGGKTSEESLTSSSASSSSSSLFSNVNGWNSDSSFISSTSASPMVHRTSHVGSVSMKSTLTGAPLSQLASSSSSSSGYTKTSSKTRIPNNERFLLERKLFSQQHKMGCADKILEWLDHVTDVLFVIGFCIIVFLKGCFLAILRYEIKEMIQKIRLLNGEDAIRSATMNELIGLTSIYDNDQGSGSRDENGDGGEGGGSGGGLGGGTGGSGDNGDTSTRILGDSSKRHSGGSGGGDRTSVLLTADTSLSNCTNTKHHYHPHMGNHVGSNHCREKLGLEKKEDLIEDDFDSSSALLGRVDSRGRSGGSGGGDGKTAPRTLPKNGNNNISATNPHAINPIMNPSAAPTELPVMASSAP